MQKHFLVSKNGYNVGPFDFSELLIKLENRELNWMDYLFDETCQDWVMILEHSQFTEKFNSGWGRPEAQPIVATSYRNPNNKFKEKEWWVLRDCNNYGPYSYVEVIQMLQEKTLFEYDYVWHQDLPAWRRVAEVADFMPETIKTLKDSGDLGVAEIFFRRRHARARYGCSLILHDNKSVYKGHSVEISAGGAGIVIPSQILQPGQAVFLHFQPGDGVPPFNAICHVVSKQFIKTNPNLPSDGMTVKYGVRFTSISQNIRESIKTFTETKVDPKAA
jgi:hypothetical protein